jgi:cytochrome c peroxidase
VLDDRPRTEGKMADTARPVVARALERVRRQASKRALGRASKTRRSALAVRLAKLGPSGRVAAPLLAACVALWGAERVWHAAHADDAKGKLGPHGALPMQEQLKLLEKLEPHPADGPPPLGIDQSVWKASIPEDNALNEARAALGRALYFDTRLSKDGTVACATCHDVSKAFTDRRPVSEGVGDKLGRRNAPITANAMLLQTQFWDGRAARLEDQARLPITNPIEMAMPDEPSAVKAIAGDAKYKELFQKAYGRDVNFDDLARAIASFERTLLFLDAPFDRFLAGDVTAISDEAKLGWTLFLGKGRCVSCHQFNAANPLGTNNKFHNIGVSARHKDFEALAVRAVKELEAAGNSTEAKDRLALETDLSELGRYVVTLHRADIGGFRTSQLRNIGVSAPYMHDGSLTTLWDVIDHYNKGGEPNPYLDGGIEPLALTENEVSALVAFLFTLSDARFAEQNESELSRQKGLAAKQRPFRDENMAMRKLLQFESRLAGKPADSTARDPAKEAP